MQSQNRGHRGVCSSPELENYVTSERGGGGGFRFSVIRTLGAYFLTCLSCLHCLPDMPCVLVSADAALDEQDGPLM